MARETAEEVGLLLDPTGLRPQVIVSLPSINQIYVGFLALLDHVPTPTPMAPEALDARWFTLADYPHEEIWNPVRGFDVADMFSQVRSRRFRFYQWTADSVRSFGPYSMDDEHSHPDAGFNL